MSWKADERGRKREGEGEGRHARRGCGRVEYCTASPNGLFTGRAAISTTFVGRYRELTEVQTAYVCNECLCVSVKKNTVTGFFCLNIRCCAAVVVTTHGSMRKSWRPTLLDKKYLAIEQLLEVERGTGTQVSAVDGKQMCGAAGDRAAGRRATPSLVAECHPSGASEGRRSGVDLMERRGELGARGLLNARHVQRRRLKMSAASAAHSCLWRGHSRRSFRERIQGPTRRTGIPVSQEYGVDWERECSARAWHCIIRRLKPGPTPT